MYMYRGCKSNRLSFVTSLPFLFQLLCSLLEEAEESSNTSDHSSDTFPKMKRGRISSVSLEETEKNNALSCP